MKAHSIKTDNFQIENKIKLRKKAVEHLKEVRVLDLFAGENRIWSQIKTDYYFGVEKEKGKGKNLNVDNLRVIENLDLSKFNVIDVDSYGIPFNQVSKIFKNKTLQNGTVIIFTCITNKMSGINKDCLKYYNLTKLYKKVKTLFNKYSRNYFYGFLYELGIKKVFKYTIEKNFIKDYGFFFVDK